MTTYAIPVYPLVQKFLAHHYATSPFLITAVRHSNPYASYLHGCLDRYDFREEVIPKKYAHLTARLTVGISSWHIKKCAAGKLSPQKISSFNDFVRQMFFEKLTYEVALNTARGMGIKTAMEIFLGRYGITEDELSIQIALRYYDRQRRKLLLTYCPVSGGSPAVILPHGRDCTDWQMEPRGGQVA